MTTNTPDRFESGEQQVPSVEIANFDAVRNALHRRIVSNYWHDGRINPSRNAYRPSFEDLFGPGGSLGMPLAASYFSSGPDADTKDTNIVAFPEASDRSFTRYMEEIGLLGKHVFIKFHDFPQVAEEFKRDIYNVDELPEEWDRYSSNSARMMRLVNTKKYLNELSAFAAPYETVDMRYTNAEDFQRIGGGSTVYVKTNNTENTGKGVYPCHTQEEYVQTVKALLKEAVEHDLDYELVLQARVDGTNQSFQFFMTPENPESIQVMTVSKQYVADDGKTYLGNENPPLTHELITPEVTSLMVDMANRIRTLDPRTFGFVMCDYFSREGKAPLAFDPGLRPTGNTATILAKMFVEREINQTGFHSSFFPVDAHGEEKSFKEYSRPAKKMMGPEAAARDGMCIMPWGYNHLQGSGLFIAISKVRDDLEGIVTMAKDALSSR